MDVNEIKGGLETTLLGRQIHFLQTVDSTNREARDLAEKGAAEGTIVLAEEQTAGRGRLDRSWHSMPGQGLWLSIILRPKIAPAVAPGLSLVTGLTLAQTIEEKLQVAAQVKWPNDCLLNGRKTAGILLDLAADANLVRHVVIGVGINVLHSIGDFPAELQKTATSLSLAAGYRVDRVAFLQAFLETLERNYLCYLDEGLVPFVEPYANRCSLIGYQVEVSMGGKLVTGKAVKIDSSGALVIDDGQKTIVLTAGEVIRVRK